MTMFYKLWNLFDTFILYYFNQRYGYFIMKKFFLLLKYFLMFLKKKKFNVWKSVTQTLNMFFIMFIHKLKRTVLKFKKNYFSVLFPQKSII